MSNKCERTRQVLRHCAGRCVPARARTPHPFPRPSLLSISSRSPDEVVESTREVTDGKPLEALDGSFMRPLLGEGAAKAMPEMFSGMSDMLRVAEKMQRAVQELMPGALPPRCATPGACAGRHWLLLTQLLLTLAARVAELEEAMPRLGAGRGMFGGALPRGDSEHGGEERKKPPRSSRFDEV